MNVQQNELSKSYTESIHSFLNDDDDYDNDIHSSSFDPEQRRASYRSIATDMSTASSPYVPPSAHYQQKPTNNSDDEESLAGPHTPTPLPKMQMFIVSVMLFSDPLTSTIILPFIYFMLKDFHLSDDEKEIGTYAGWITSVFFLAQFCTAILWGRVSDRHGRRPVLLMGLIGNSISSTLFGLSKSLLFCILARAFCGFFNGNGGVARSMLSEITDTTNRAKAFSIFGFCWGIGMIGPALGGFLCKPAEHFPSLFGDNAFLIEYPYFLPCFVSSLGSLVGYVVGYFYLEESNPTVVAMKKQQQQQHPDDETTGLLSSAATVSSFTPSTKKSTTTSAIAAPTTHPLLAFKSIGRNSAVTILAYSLFAFHAMVFDEVLPLYFSTPTYAGGLGSTAQELAKVLSICGLWQLVSQFYVFPWINRRYDTLTMTRASLIIFAISYALFPELSTYKDWLADHVESETSGMGLYLLRAGYLSLLTLRIFGNCMAFTGMMVMTNNSAGPGMLGTINGLLQSCLSLVRSLGPTVGGTLWSLSLKYDVYPFDRHLVYYMIAILAVISWIQSYSIPRSLALGGKH
ncbi:major facilitator superfamily domain-containing protein [Absidia repens]|uniref:Major facilitator superfamily domain-containing protein n=1 Tax=Absidia repens TaxID=90262 RepID=A0A1X2I7Q9_9FUNG|nr:major facilitator superfamily domain-containing protein [Absidia repens]